MKTLRIILLAFILLVIRQGLFAQTPSFTSFDAQPCEGQLVIVQWTFDPAADSLSFIVERSRDKTTWEKIGHIDNDDTHQYFSIDSDPGEGVIYYRVKQVNGSAVTVKWVQIGKDGELYLWPNPATDMIRLKTPFKNGKVDILDASGNIMTEVAITNTVTDIPLVRLSRGVYYIHANCNNKTLVERFVRE